MEPFKIKENPIKGAEVELQNYTLFLPPLTLRDYTENDADEKLIKIQKYSQEQTIKREKHVNKIQELNIKITSSGIDSLTPEERVELENAIENINLSELFNKDIIKTSIELIYLSAKKNYPNITIDALYDEIDFDTLREIMPLLQTQGKEERKLASKNAQKQVENIPE